MGIFFGTQKSSSPETLTHYIDANQNSSYVSAAENGPPSPRNRGSSFSAIALNYAHSFFATDPKSEIQKTYDDLLRECKNNCNRAFSDYRQNGKALCRKIKMCLKEIKKLERRIAKQGDNMARETLDDVKNKLDDAKANLGNLSLEINLNYVNPIIKQIDRLTEAAQRLRSIRIDDEKDAQDFEKVAEKLETQAKLISKSGAKILKETRAASCFEYARINANVVSTPRPSF